MTFLKAFDGGKVRVLMMNGIEVGYGNTIYIHNVLEYQEVLSNDTRDICNRIRLNQSSSVLVI